MYFPEQMLQEIREHAVRLDRSLSWIMQRAWQVARKELQAVPAATDIEPTDQVPGTTMPGNDGVESGR